MKFSSLLLLAIGLSLCVSTMRCSSLDDPINDNMDVADETTYNDNDAQQDQSNVDSDNNDNAEDENYDINNPPGLTSKCIFPSDITPGTLYAGKPRPIVVGIENQLSSGNNYWVHYIYASLYHPKNKNQLLQNMTATKYVQPVLAQSGSTFSYMIWLHDSFAEKNFTLVIFAHMTDDKREYIYPVYNETIRFLELPENVFDLKFIFLIVVLVTTTSVVSKLLIQRFSKNAKNNKPKPKSQTSTAKKDYKVDPEWLPAELKKKTKLSNN